MDYVITNGVLFSHLALQKMKDDTPPIGPVLGNHKIHSHVSEVQRATGAFCH